MKIRDLDRDKKKESIGERIRGFLETSGDFMDFSFPPDTFFKIRTARRPLFFLWTFPQICRDITDLDLEEKKKSLNKQR